VVRARIVILLALVMALNVPAMADAVDLGALLSETEGAVTRLDNGIEKARMLVALARGYAKHGDRLRALHWLNRAVNLALSIPPDWISIDALLNRDQLLRQAVEEQATLGDFAGALRNAKAWSDSDRPRIATCEEYSDVAKCQAKAGDVAGAWATCDLIHPRWGRPMALASVAVTLAESRRFDAALASIDRLDKIPAEDKDAAEVNQSYRNQSLLMIAREQARCGRFQEALRTADRPHRDSTKIEALEAIARIRLELSDQPGAREAVARAVRLFTRLDAAERKPFGAMATFQAKVGDVPGALETASKYLEGGGKGPALLSISIAQSKLGERAKAAQNFKEGLALAKSRGADLLNAALEQAQGHEFDRAMEMAHFVGRPGLVLQEVAVELARMGNVGRALQIARAIRHEPDKAETLSTLATIQAKAKDPLARQTFQRAFEAAMADGDEVVALKKVGLAQVRAGYPDAAADTFREARRRVIRLKPEEVKLADIARAQAGGGDPAGAVAWARSQSSRLLRAQGLVAVLEGLTEGPE
jgi:tetratricopeptide (TPR) repeat protein